MTITSLLVCVGIGIGIGLLPWLFPIKGEHDLFGVVIVLCRRSKWTRWLTWQIITSEDEEEYLDRMERRMNAE